MVSGLEVSLSELKSLFFNFTSLVEENVSQATDVMLNNHFDKIQAIEEIDKEIDKKEIHIEESCSHILAMHQPKAKDLRLIIAILKINNDLERIGDLGMNLARSVRRLNKFDTQNKYSLPLMVEKVLKMLNMSLLSFMNMDSELAISVCKLDDEVDHLKSNQRKELKHLIKSEPMLADYFFEILVNARRLERIADLATNIAEEVIYIADGKIIRHRKWTDVTL